MLNGFCPSKRYTEEDYELHTSVIATCEAAENMKKANEMTRLFWASLPYRGKYKALIKAGEYTVNSFFADDFPDYFGGTYINVKGNLVVAVTKKYMRHNYRKKIWYKELIGIFGCEDFICRAVSNNYSKLVYGMSELAFGMLGKSISEVTSGIVGYGINDYQNKVVIEVSSFEEAVKVEQLIPREIYNTIIVGDDNSRYFN